MRSDIFVRGTLCRLLLIEARLWCTSIIILRFLPSLGGLQLHCVIVMLFCALLWGPFLLTRSTGGPFPSRQLHECQGLLSLILVTSGVRIAGVAVLASCAIFSLSGNSMEIASTERSPEESA